MAIKNGKTSEKNNSKEVALKLMLLIDRVVFETGIPQRSLATKNG